MPTPILVMFFVFLLMPVASTTFIDRPVDIYAREGMWRALLVTLTYWVLPWSLCYSIALKHYLFLPLYLAQCLILLTHSIVYSHMLPLDISLARYVLVAFMAYIGVFFGNKDFLYPFLQKEHRVWRKAPRFRINYEIQLLGEKPEHKIPALVRDCSVTGMFVIVDPRHTQTFLKRKAEGDQVKAVLRWNAQERTIPAEIIWSSAANNARHLGLRVTEPDQLKPFISWVKAEMAYESKLYRAASPLLEHDVHQTALMFWVLFIALSFGLPAFAYF